MIKDAELYAMIRKAMVQLGWVFPTTEEEVEMVEMLEKDPNFSNMELPDSLKDPQEILDKHLGVAQSGQSARFGSEKTLVRIQPPRPKRR